MYGIAAACTRHVAAAAGAKRTTESTSTATVRAATSAEPRRSTFQPAWRNAAASANASASAGTVAHRLVRPAGCKPAHRRVLSRGRSVHYGRSMRPSAAWFSRGRPGRDARPCPLGGTRERALGGGEERVAEREAELVPAGDLARGLVAQGSGVGSRVIRVVEPAEHLRVRDLRVELHGPARLAEPEGLVAAVVARELDCARREGVGVVVPLERVERRRQRAEHRIDASGAGQRDLVPADFRLPVEPAAP